VRERVKGVVKEPKFPSLESLPRAKRRGAGAGFKGKRENSKKENLNRSSYISVSSE
jgi:hypothetical protein